MRKTILALLLLVGITSPLQAQSELSVYTGIVTTDDKQVVIGSSLAIPVLGSLLYVVPDAAFQYMNSDVQNVTTNMMAQVRVRPTETVAVYVGAGVAAMHTFFAYDLDECEQCSLLKRNTNSGWVAEYGFILSRPGNNMAFRVGHNMILDRFDWFKDNVVQHRFTVGLDWTL